MEPVRLTDTGEMLVIPGRPGLTDESPLPIDSMLGVHKWAGCSGGHFRLHDMPGGWTLLCTGCGMHFNVPQEVRTYGELRAFLDEELERARRGKQGGTSDKEV